MKQILKLHSDNIDFLDNRFNFKVIANDFFTQSPNSLPLFWKHNNRFIPCTHFNFNNDHFSFDALVYNGNTSYEDVLKQLIAYCDLTIFDISKILDLLETYSPSHNKIEWSALLSIPVKQWDKIKRLYSFPLQWQEYFISKNTPLKRILSFDDSLLREAVAVLLPLNPGINILEQISLLLKEISLRDEIPYETILERKNILEILQNDTLGIPQKLQSIRSTLFTERYPTISQYRLLLENKKTQLDKLKTLQISIDENFETPGIELKFIMTNMKDINNLEQWIKINKNTLSGILNFQKDNK